MSDVASDSENPNPLTFQNRKRQRGTTKKQKFLRCNILTWPPSSAAKQLQRRQDHSKTTCDTFLSSSQTLNFVAEQATESEAAAWKYKETKGLQLSEAFQSVQSFRSVSLPSSPTGMRNFLVNRPAKPESFSNLESHGKRKHARGRFLKLVY